MYGNTEGYSQQVPWKVGIIALTTLTFISMQVLLTLLSDLFATIEGQAAQYYTLLNQMKSGVILFANNRK
jgi:hypothetical protein